MNPIGAIPPFTPVPPPAAMPRSHGESDEGRGPMASAGSPLPSVPQHAASFFSPSQGERIKVRDCFREFAVQWAKWAVAALAATVLFVILFFFSPSQYPFYPRCPLHAMTGLHCPGCGSLRAVHSLLHGDIGAALHFNALLILSLPFL